MKIAELKSILDSIVRKSETLIQAGRRDDIRNERIYHHMFSNLISSCFAKKDINIWDSLLLQPESPTTKKFTWKYINLKNLAHTKKYVINRGQSGQFDFSIKTKPPIFIEWKGPELFSSKDIAQVMLKLLSEDKSSFKVFAAIITSSLTGRKDHFNKIKNHLNEGIEFACKVLDIKNLTNKNFYIFVATITDNGPQKIHWGKYS